MRPVLAAGDLLTRMGFHAGALSAGRGLPGEQTSFAVAAIQPCVAVPGLPGWGACLWPPHSTPTVGHSAPLLSGSCCDAWQWGAVVTCQALALACLEHCDALAKPFNHPDPSWQLEALPWGTGVGAVGMVLLQGSARVSTP